VRRALPVLILLGCTPTAGPILDPGDPPPDRTPAPDWPEVLVTEIHEGPDWIELFNPGDEAVDLAGWGLSDDPDEPRRHVLSGSLGPAAFLVVPAVGADGEGGAPFGLDPGGEEIHLTAPDGRVIDALVFGPQVEDVSFGRPQPVARSTVLGPGDAADVVPGADLDPIEAILPVGYDDGGGPVGNLALGRETTQSSNGYGRTGAQAVDGDLSTFSHTGDGDLESWWEVDLGTSARVAEVRIFNRIGCCPHRLYNLDVSLLDAAGEVVWAWDRFNPTADTPVDPGPEHVFELDPTVGRFLRVEKTAVGGSGSSEWMSLAEVEVTGAPAAPFADRLATEVRPAEDRVWIQVPAPEPVEGEGTVRWVLTVEADDAWRVEAPAGVVSGGLGDDGTVEGPAEPLRTGEIVLGTRVPDALSVEVVNVAADDVDFFASVELVAEDIVTERDGEAWFAVPTPGAPNGTGFAGFVAPPEVDPPRGFFGAPFDAAVGSSTPEALLVYTLDGSVPTLDNGVQVPGGGDGPIVDLPVATTGILRAAAFREGWEPSEVVTHTWIFPADVLLQPDDPEGFPAAWDGLSQPPAAADYGMDPDVVNDPDTAAELLAGLTSIRTMSIVMPREDLFGDEGIYVHSQQRGAAWERAASVEILEPDGSTGVATLAGVRIHGYGWRPHSNTRKHALRLEFRSRYGPTKLEYPLFEDAPVDRFDSIVLRCQGSRGWQDFRDPEQSQYIRDSFARDTAAAMGKVDGHATYVHLYLNGLYWGLYNPVERPDADFGAEYFGGVADDYDAINRRTTTNEAIDGTLDAYYQLLALADGPVDTPEGLAAVEAMLDLDDLIDYMLIHQYTANRDGPERFNHNNMRGVRRRPDGLFRWFVWDMEYSLWYAEDHINIDVDVAGSISHVYARLRAVPEFRARYAERAALHLGPGGALSADLALARYEARAEEIYTAVLGESARWGDADRAVPYTRDVEWAEERRRLTEEFFPFRTDVLIGQLQAAGLMD